MHDKKIIISVVGMPGSGKSLVAAMLKDMGFHVVELGDIWRELLKKNHISRSDPVETREFTRKIREKYGKEVYARHAYRKILKSWRKVAIMGVRSTYEMDYFKKRMKKMCVVALLAPIALRFSRLKKRGKPEDHNTMAGFRWQDKRERRGFMTAKSEEKHGVMTLIRASDYVIANTSTVKNLRANLAEIIKKAKE